MKAMEQLERTFKGGATLAVREGGRELLPPWPVDYLKVEGGLVEYTWTGYDERVHSHPVDSVEAGDDGEVRIVTADGYTLVVEPIWRPADADVLRRWCEIVKSDPQAKRYPEGGWRYEV
ncbi:MAG: hypothetical protein AB1609_21390 [Bacillota bacterium]